MSELNAIVELSGADLDAVAGGASNRQGGLVNVGLTVDQIDVLRGADIDIIDNVTVTLRDIANHNNIGVGALIQVLGGPGAVILPQVQ